jgi:hypothetical protein
MVSLLLTLGTTLPGQLPAWPSTCPPPRWQPSDAWRNSDFAVLQSELSPAVLIWSKSSTLRLFANLEQWGLGGPSELLMHTPKGPQLLQYPPEGGEGVRGPASPFAMDRAWIGVSFRGSKGWSAWDVPLVVVLQHRLERMRSGPAGLELTFSGPAGFVAVMPLHGARRFVPPQAAAVAPHRLTEDADLCEFWARALRFWPLNCREESQVLPKQDVLRLRGTCEYVEIKDDWNTKSMQLAPLPPTLALALHTGFPAKVSPLLRVDLAADTAYGPYAVVSGDTYTVDFPIKHLNQTETQQPPNLDDAIVALAAQQVAQRMQRKFTDAGEERIWDHGGGGNYCWQVMGDRWYAKALAYTPEPARSNARACLAAYMRDWVLNEAKYKPFRGKLILEGPGIGNWGGYDDSGKFSSNILETLWCYAYYTGDWDLIRERWDTILKLFVTPRECRWRGFGRDAIAEMGDEAAPPLCLARMAYQIGDLDTYAYASHIYARECVHLWVKTKPECAEWFRGLQPWHSAEPMQGPLFLTNLWGDVAGWQIDGPDYPKETGERQYRNRWVRFSNEDVGAFLRESVGEETLRKELDWWLTRDDNPYKPGASTAHIAPSMEQLRSLLLNESPDDLAKLTPIQDAKIGRAADAVSYYLSFVRTGRPVQYTRLIPTNLPDSPWMLGLERESDGSDGALVVSVLSKDGQWPTICDWGWKPPQEAGDLPGAKRWPFGQIIAGDTPPTLKWERLSWVTNVRYAE